ncbi:MAG: hypothetical protein NTU53_13115 [Planctomycetota bacterium]|nr:hypothetical protein [Planctomycetota bacterium]
MMHNRLHTPLSVLSLLLCVAVAFMFTRSQRSHDRLGFFIGQGGYTMHSQQGKLVLTGPPAGASAAPEAEKLVAQMTNDDLRWMEILEVRNGTASFVDVKALPVEGSVASTISKLPEGPDALKRPLLRALDDPGKFVAAHVLLTHYVQRRWRAPADKKQECVRVAFNGLDVELRPEGAQRDYRGLENNSHWMCFEHQVAGSWWADPAQRKRIRDQWHDRLDVRLVSIPYWLVLAVCLFPPFRWCYIGWRRVQRKKRGLCSECGYDLRATRDRCPECGSLSST